MASNQTIEVGRDFGKELAERPRAAAQAALNPDRYADTPLPQAGVDQLQYDAQKNGFVAAIAAGFASAGSVFMANALSPRFRNALGVSGKAALVVTPSAGAFFLNSLQTVDRAIKDPDAYRQGGASAPTSMLAASPQSSLTLWQTMCNTIYYHPFKTIVAIASPLYAGIFYRESTQKTTRDMLLSQRLIHTRVYGQMVAVLTTVGVMSFCKFMDDYGEYRLVGGVVTRTKDKVNPYRSMYEDGGAEAESRGKGSRRTAAAAAATAGVTGAPSSTASADKAMLAAMEQRRAEEEKRIEDEFYASRAGAWNFMVPLLYAPLLPMIRLGLRNRVPPERITHISLGVIGVALAHAGTIMFSDSSVAMRK